MTTKEYESADLTVYWTPEICQHAGECVRGSKKIFDPSRRPWIILDNGEAHEIANIIDRCPSKALRYSWKEQQ